MHLIRLNEKYLSRLSASGYGSVKIFDAYALFSYRGDRLKYTTLPASSVDDVLDEIIFTKSVRKGLTWFGFVENLLPGATEYKFCKVCCDTTNHKNGVCQTH